MKDMIKGEKVYVYDNVYEISYDINQLKSEIKELRTEIREIKEEQNAQQLNTVIVSWLPFLCCIAFMIGYKTMSKFRKDDTKR